MSESKQLAEKYSFKVELVDPVEFYDVESDEFYVNSIEYRPDVLETMSDREQINFKLDNVENVEKL